MKFRLIEGDGPVLVSVPHAGTRLLPGMSTSSPAWQALPDTDWHVDRLVDFAPRMGASLLVAEYSRYVIDLNRPADDQPLYDQVGTGLVPTETFSGQALYLPGQVPDQSEQARRVAGCWQPYHQAIEDRLSAIRAVHGHAILFDVHSIASRVPRLFDGQLPDLNLGTFAGRSCAESLERACAERLANAEGFSSISNGRFKGGYITRHYGQPESGVHALQLEIAQCCYMDEDDPRQWDEQRAAPLKALLRDLIALLSAWRPA